MNLGFLMSHYRKNSVRDKVIGKKWIYLETECSPSQMMRTALVGKHSTECGPSQKARGLKIWHG